MSSISSVSSGGVDLYNILQSATANTNGVGSNIATAQTPQNAPGVTDPDGDGDQQVQGTHHGHHGHHGLQGQIQSAVTSALENSDSSTDPNQAVQNAIAAVLKGGAEGVNPDGSNGQDGNGAAQGAGGADATSPSQFAQLLQSNGITPQDFQNDLNAAWTDNGSGGQSLNFSTLFQSFPPGTALDTTA